jgi:hypothetical protein
VTSRRRTAILATAAACLLVASVAIAWRQIDRREGARARGEARGVSALLAGATRAVGSAEDERAGTDAFVTETERARDALDALAASLRVELDRVKGERDTTAIAALASGVRAGVVAQCLQGVQQALNQLSVGDRGGIASLQRVSGPCREAAA